LGLRYELRYLIASGATADVYAAFDRTQHRSVVVKLLQQRFAADPIANARLRREGEILGTIESPRVVALYDSGTDHDATYLVLERLHGLTIDQELRRFGPFSATRACGIALDILAGITAVHRSGYVHRRIEGSNVMVDFDDRAVLLDVGVAHQELDVRVDLHQLGILLLHMTTGIAIDHETGHEALLRLPQALVDVAVNAIAARYQSTSGMASAIMTAMLALRRSEPALVVHVN